MHHGDVTSRGLSISTQTPVVASPADSASPAAAGVSALAPETALVSTALDSATPAALLAGAIDVEQAPRPLSVFDLMRIGIGPSSSHTVGPMRAGRAFSRELAEAVRPGGTGASDGECDSRAVGAGLPQPTRVTVELYGSLGATGRGHATDRAAVMGMAGYEPETVPAVVCESLMEEVEAAGELVVDGVGPVPFSPSADIHFLPGRVLPYHVNGMTLTAYCASGAEILRRTYYSVGGGFVMEDVGAPGSPSIQALATASTTEAHANGTDQRIVTSIWLLAAAAATGNAANPINATTETSSSCA